MWYLHDKGLSVQNEVMSIMQSLLVKENCL
jgi:hypothetical protein